MGEVTHKQLVVLLGAGKVASHLAPALIEAGYPIAQVYSRTLDAARVLADPLGVPYTDNIEAVTTDAHIYIACVADGALSAVAAKVVHNSPDKIFLHTAGSVPMEIWREAGAQHYGILYPLQTFSKEREVNMHEVSLFIEASDASTLKSVELLAQRLSRKVYYADSALRAQLHVAAVFACNFTNAMYGVAHQLLDQAHIPFEVLLPLIDETAAKVHTLSPHEAQTGPAVRGDHNVMQHHVEQLAHLPELQSLYKQISDFIGNHH